MRHLHRVEAFFVAHRVNITQRFRIDRPCQLSRLGRHDGVAECGGFSFYSYALACPQADLVIIIVRWLRAEDARF